MPNREDEDDDDDLTPTQGIVAPRSGTALNLADLALSGNEVLRSVQEASASIDGLSGLDRRHRLFELGNRLVKFGGLFVEAGVALKEEGRRG